MCWVQVIYAIIIAIIGEAIRPKQKSNSGKPAGLGDFNFPTSEAGRAFPYLAGTVKIEGPNVTAAGNLRSEESYKRIRTGWWTTAKESYGFRYYMNIQMVVCGTCLGGPIDAVQSVQVNEKALKCTITTTEHYIDVNVQDKSFFGDAKKDGGFAGTIRFWRGTQTQGIDTYLQQTLNETDISAYRFVCYMMFRNFYVGMSASPAPFVPVVSRWPNTLGVPGGKHVVGTTAANVLATCYDLMTDPIRCAGITSDKIDKPAFLAAAIQTHDEGIGVNTLIDTTGSLDDALKSLMQYADGQIFEDPFTGLWTVKLARGDYDVDDLLLLDETNSRCVGRTKTDWADTKNVITVKYVDKTKNWTNQSVTVQDQANLIALGQQVNATELDFSGADNVDLANYLAERARASLSTPFAQLDIEVDGRGLLLKPNDVFKGSYPGKRIDLMILRITDIEYATVDEAVTKITAVEDKFGVKYVAYDPPPISGWVPPTDDPVDAANTRIEEISYGMTPDEARTTPAILSMAARAGGREVGYDIWSTTPIDGSMHFVAGVDGLTAIGSLVTALSKAGPYTGATVVLTNVIDAQNIDPPTPEEFAAGQAIMCIGNELIAYKTVTVDPTTGNYVFGGCVRGLYDTVPADHSTTAVAFFYGEGMGMVAMNATDFSVATKLLMRTASETLPIGSATEHDLTTVHRAVRPYRPGNVMVDGQPLLAASALSIADGTLALTWVQRNRLTQDRAIIGYVDATVAPEASTTYTARFYKTSDGTLINTTTGLTGTSGAVDLGAFIGGVRMEIVAVRDTFESYQAVVGNLSIAVTELLITNAAPDGAMTEAYDFTYTATGGIPGYTWSITAGALPDGLSMSSGGHITGTPTASGDFSYVVTVTDSVGSATPKTEAVHIDLPPPLSISGNAPDGYVDYPYPPGA